MKTEPIRLVLVGAGGKMGCRLTDHLQNHPDYAVQYVETGARGLANLSARNLRPTDLADALANAQVVILALPDRVLGSVARQIVPALPSGCMLFTLDPAAAHAGELPQRPDITYFISHPCHPSVFDHFATEAERDDFFGGTVARQAIVCALMQGPDEHYALGEKIARDIYGPITRAHRITVEQMAILEPALAETTCIAVLATLREALEEAVNRGVPRAAAEDFLYGHIKVIMGIIFGRAQFPLSDGAKLIGDYGIKHLIQPDWKKLFEPESVKDQVRAIVRG
jgi:D-apionate oxidoisomerase